MTPVCLTIPVRLVSEANAHEHWRVRQKRAKEQRGLAVMMATGPVLSADASGHVGAGERLVVTLTRVAPYPLDTDNAVGAAKHIRDGIADALGINDRSPLVEWRYGQRKPKAGEPKYGVDVRIESLSWRHNPAEILVADSSGSVSSEK